MTDETERAAVSPAIRTIFGAIAGLTMGALASAACCLVIGFFDLFEYWVLVGAIAGTTVGVIWVTARHPQNVADVDSESFSKLGFLFGLTPAVCLSVAVLSGAVRLKGILLTPAGCMIGLLFGAFIDRAFEDARVRKKFTAAVTIVVHIALAVWVLTMIDAACNFGPAPSVVCNKLGWKIISELTEDNKEVEHRINTIHLSRSGRRSYNGFVDVSYRGSTERLSLSVKVTGAGLAWETGPYSPQ